MVLQKNSGRASNIHLLHPYTNLFLSAEKSHKIPSIQPCHLAEHLVRREEPVSLTRSLVQLALDFFQEFLSNVREIRALGYILADEAVGVLIGSTLPGMVWTGKEESHVCYSGDSLVLCELQAVVSGDGLYEVILLEAFEDADNLVGSFCGSGAL